MAPSPIQQNNLKCNYWPIPIGLYTHPSYLALLTYKLSPEELCTVIRHFYQTSLIIQKCGSMEVVCMYRKRECVCYEIIFELSLSYNKFSLSRLTSFAIAFAFALRITELRNFATGRDLRSRIFILESFSGLANFSYQFSFCDL